MAAQAPILLQPPLTACPPLVPHQGPKAFSKTIVPTPLHSKRTDNINKVTGKAKQSTTATTTLI
jgi:hypothetical protein